MKNATPIKPPPTKTAVIHIDRRRVPQTRTVTAQLEEALGLAEAIDLDVVYTQVVPVHRISPSLLMGSGNAENIAEAIKAYDIKLVIVNHSLSPVHHRNLEKLWNCKVIDRTGLILEIFGERAQTAEGVMQVELAALKHQRSRLVRSWTHLERQRGGFGFTGGPGEKQIELDRRLIDGRIQKLEKQLEHFKSMRSLHRRARQRSSTPVVALVGYTNAGKSTLFNQLTQAGVVAKDQLFATLDPTMRPVKLPSGLDIILSDTVGFISDLPTHLVAAFRATLEEVCCASLILHVRDVAHPDSEAQARDVMTVLEELGLDPEEARTNIIDVYNKTDLLNDEELSTLHNKTQRQENAVAISAEKCINISTLLHRIGQFLTRDNPICDVVIPAHRGDILAFCYRKGAILTREDHEETIHLTLRLSKGDLEMVKLGSLKEVI